MIRRGYGLIFLLVATAASTMAMAAGRVPSFATRDDVQSFIADMSVRHGFDRVELADAFAEIHPLPAVIKAITPPSDPAVRSWHNYRARFVEPKRIAAGKRFWATNAATLRAASERYQIPEEIIVAIIGVETIFGRNTGRFNTLAAIATLAFDYPPRATLFREELEALLLLAREQKRDPLAYRGSYAGALGLPQFLPSSVRQWGVDFDGNGRIDLDTAADAIGSVATFLYAHGWQPNEAIAAPVTVTADNKVQTLIDEGIRPQRLPAEMAAMGVQAAQAIARPAALIDLVTPGSPTEYWLGYQNFFVLTRYNRSSFYAMAVHQLAEALLDANQDAAVSPPSRLKAKRHARGSSNHRNATTKSPE
jgi:membrane-bound lytic murein transglycosylase B